MKKIILFLLCFIALNVQAQDSVFKSLSVKFGMNGYEIVNCMKYYNSNYKSVSITADKLQYRDSSTKSTIIHYLDRNIYYRTTVIVSGSPSRIIELFKKIADSAEDCYELPSSFIYDNKEVSYPDDFLFKMSSTFTIKWKIPSQSVIVYVKVDMKNSHLIYDITKE